MKLGNRILKAMIAETNNQRIGIAQRAVSSDRTGLVADLWLVSGLAASPAALILPSLMESANPEQGYQGGRSLKDRDNLRPIAPGEVHESP